MSLDISDSTNDLARVVNAVYKETYLRQGKSRCLHFQGTEPAEVMKNRGSLVCNWQQMSNLVDADSATVQTAGVEIPTYVALTELTSPMPHMVRLDRLTFWLLVRLRQLLRSTVITSSSTKKPI